jgi:hypothetical protein
MVELIELVAGKIINKRVLSLSLFVISLILFKKQSIIIEDYSRKSNEPEFINEIFTLSG